MWHRLKLRDKYFLTVQNIQYVIKKISMSDVYMYIYSLIHESNH